MTSIPNVWRVGVLSECVLATTTVSAGPTVTVLNGTYEGVYLPAFNQDIFLGIPYVQDTGGQNRFRIPQSLALTWNGTRPAKEYGDTYLDPSDTDSA